MIKAQSAPALVPIRYGLRATGPTELAPSAAGSQSPPSRAGGQTRKEACARSPGVSASRPSSASFSPWTAICGFTTPIMHRLPPRTNKRLATPTATSPAAHMGLTLSLARRGSPAEATDLAISGMVEYLFNGEITCMLTDADPTNAPSVAASRTCIGQRHTAWGRVRLVRSQNLKPTVSP
jgi:hypothetical protein